MIHLQRITTADTTQYAYMEHLMECSFPPEEHRPLDELRQYTDHKSHFHVHIITCDQVPAGFITCWDFGHFRYLEHFAIDPAYRNGGYGKQVLELLCRESDLPIVLEVEMPETEMARRRIGFYQRAGFQLWTKPYKQPPYRDKDGYLPMLLMVHGPMDCEKDFETVQWQIYQEVYHVKERPQD